MTNAAEGGGGGDVFWSQDSYQISEQIIRQSPNKDIHTASWAIRMMAMCTFRELKVSLFLPLQTITLWTPETNELRKTLALPYPDEEIK